MIENIISPNPDAPILVIYGSNMYTRDAVLNQLKSIGDITVWGTLNEEEGNKKVLSLPRINLVLIGRAYGMEQRDRIRKFINLHLPNTAIIEAGVYNEQDIISRINQILFSKKTL